MFIKLFKKVITTGADMAKTTGKDFIFGAIENGIRNAIITIAVIFGLIYATIWGFNKISNSMSNDNMTTINVLQENESASDNNWIDKLNIFDNVDNLNKK